MLDHMILIYLRLTLIISLICTSSLKISFGHDLIILEFGLLPPISTFFVIVFCNITRLTLKRIISNFYLTFRLKFIHMLRRITDIVSIVGARLFKSSFWHDVIIRKCNFIPFFCKSFLIVILNIIRLTSKFTSNSKFPFSLNNFPSTSLIITNIIIEIWWAPLKVPFGNNLILWICNFISSNSLIRIIFIWSSITRLMLIFILRKDEIFIYHIVFSNFVIWCIKTLLFGVTLIYFCRISIRHVVR